MINVFKIILTELVENAVRVKSDGDDAGHYWEIKVTDKKMRKIEKELNWDMTEEERNEYYEKLQEKQDSEKLNVQDVLNLLKGFNQ